MQRSSFNYLKRLLRSGGGGGGGDGGVGNGGGVRWYRRSEYEVKVGVSEFLRGIGRGVEGHVAKIEAEIGDVNKLLQTRTLRLKKLGIPCNHVWILFALSFFTRISIPKWSDQIYYLCLCCLLFVGAEKVDPELCTQVSTRSLEASCSTSQTLVSVSIYGFC